MSAGFASSLCMLRALLAGMALSAAAQAAVRIERTSQAVDAAEVCRAGVQALGEWLQARSGAVQLSPECTSVAWQVPPGWVELRPRPLLEGELPARRMRVWVDIWVDGQPARAVQVPVRVQATRLAWVARQDVQAGQSLADGALELRDVDVVGLGAAPVSAELLPGSLRLRKPLLAGKVLTSAHVETPPTVTRGQTVRLRTQSGVISLVTDAQALQDGEPGQRVLVRVKHAVGPVAAWVVGPNVVELKQ